MRWPDESAAADSIRAGTTFGDGIAPYFKDWLAHPNFDEYGSSGRSRTSTRRLKMPVLIIRLGTIFFWAAREELREVKTDGGTERRAKAAIGGYRGRPRGASTPEKWWSGVWEQIADGYG